MVITVDRGILAHQLFTGSPGSIWLLSRGVGRPVVADPDETIVSTCQMLATPLGIVNAPYRDAALARHRLLQDVVSRFQTGLGVDAVIHRWSGHVEPNDGPYRPWVGGRDRDLSYRATPVRFQTVKASVGSDCRCGMGLKADVNGGDHAGRHAQWAFGVRVPKSLDWLGDLVVVTTQSAIVWRRLVYKVAKMPQRENHYDFRSWSHLGEPEETEDNVQAYLLQANGYVIGYLATHDTDHHRPWDLVDESEFGKADDTLRPRIDLVWVADAYRRQGVGATLVQTLADDFGSPISEVSWSTPISRSGRQLARRLSPDGIWVS